MLFTRFLTPQPMRYTHPSRWWLIPALAVPGAIGAALLPLVLPHPIGIVLCVNLLLPCTVVIGAAVYPRAWSPIASAPLAMVGFTLTRAFLQDHQFWQWKPTWLVGQVLSPIVVVATLAGAFAAAVAVVVVRTRIRVGLDLPPGACKHCHYPAGRNKICPECGKPNPNATI